MEEIHTSGTTPPISVPGFDGFLTYTREHDAIALAERLFGAPQHMILISDTGPSLAIMGWKLGTGRAESAAADGRVTGLVEVDLMFSEEETYAICERAQVFPARGPAQLRATVTPAGSREEVLAFFERMSLDPMRDAACCTALDHVARFWPFLGRRKRRRSEEYKLPFAL